MLNLLRNRIKDLHVQFHCVVDYFGLSFEVSSPVPLTLSTLVYGSDCEGKLFVTEAEFVAKQIAKVMNIAPQLIREELSGKIKTIYLPQDVQIHKHEAKNEYYLINAYALLCHQKQTN